MKNLLIIISIVSAVESFRYLGASRKTLKVRDGPPDQWFTQRLDHSDPTNLNTWQQRYQVNDTYFKDKATAPAFLLIGAEGAADGNWITQGEWMENAAKYGAIVFQLEHRFYGESHPLSDMSTESLKYLTTDQALDDIAYFIESANKNYTFTAANKWIVFGFSYGGSMAAWARYKYPHIIHGGVSISGPINVQANYSQYYDVVLSTLEESSPQCSESMLEAVQQFGSSLTPIKLPGLIQQLRICNTIDINNSDDINTMMSNLFGTIGNVVQNNELNNVFYPDALSSFTVDDLCRIMTDVTLGDPLTRLGVLNSKFLDANGSPCLDHSYSDMINFLKMDQWSQIADIGGRQWIYQTCTEIGLFPTSSSYNEIVGPFLPLDWYIKRCTDVFGENFNKELLDEGIKRNQINYGGDNLAIKRLVFVHGSNDPWHLGGEYYSKFYETPVIVIEGGAHCSDMFPSRDSDSTALKAARQLISSYIGDWLQED